MSVPLIANTVPDEIQEEQQVIFVDQNDDVLLEQSEQLQAIVEILTPSEADLELEEQQALEQQENAEIQQELLFSISEDLNKLVTVISKQEEEDVTSADSTNQILISLTDSVDEMNAFLEEKSQIEGAADSTIIGYGAFYIPLIVIIIALWWFFKQFLTDFR